MARPREVRTSTCVYMYSEFHILLAVQTVNWIDTFACTTASSFPRSCIYIYLCIWIMVDRQCPPSPHEKVYLHCTYVLYMHVYLYVGVWLDFKEKKEPRCSTISMHAYVYTLTYTYYPVCNLYYNYSFREGVDNVSQLLVSQPSCGKLGAWRTIASLVPRLPNIKTCMIL
jgi:hypothetical protein